MIEPLDAVYVSLRRPRGSYHRGHGGFGLHPTMTDCGFLKLADCEELLEIEAAMTHEPCSRCFPLRGRRQRILNLVTGVEDLEATA